MDFIQWLVSLVKREPNLNKLLVNLTKQQAKLEAAGDKLQNLAAAKKAKAEAIIERAKAQTEEADRACRVAERIKALTD